MIEIGMCHCLRGAIYLRIPRRTHRRYRLLFLMLAWPPVACDAPENMFKTFCAILTVYLVADFGEGSTCMID